MPLIFGENGQRTGLHIPCGCTARKEIMFKQGGAGRTELLLILLPLIMLGGAWYVKNRG